MFTAITAAIPMEAVPRIPEILFGNLFPNNPVMRNAASGRIRIKAAVEKSIFAAQMCENVFSVCWVTWSVMSRKQHQLFGENFCMNSSAIETMFAEPINKGVRSCNDFGCFSRMREYPSLDLPPASSIIHERGLHSYSRRNFPLGDFAVEG